MGCARVVVGSHFLSRLLTRRPLRPNLHLYCADCFSFRDSFQTTRSTSIYQSLRDAAWRMEYFANDWSSSAHADVLVRSHLSCRASSLPRARDQDYLVARSDHGCLGKPSRRLS